MRRWLLIWLWMFAWIAAGCSRPTQQSLIETAVASTLTVRPTATVVAPGPAATTRPAAAATPARPTVVTTGAARGATSTRPADRLSAAATPSPSALAEALGRCLRWNEAKNYDGQTQCVCGPVVDTFYASRSNGAPTFLNLGANRNSPNRFTVVIWGEYRPNFDRPPEQAYRGKIICVTGRIRLYRGVPEIQVKSPAEIEAE